MNPNKEPYLQVLWTRKCLLKNKEFSISKKEQAFNWYWRINGDQIVLRKCNDEWDTSFTEAMVLDRIKWNPTKEGYREVFESWLKEQLDPEM